VVLTATTLFLSTGALLPLLVFGPDTGDAHLNASLLGSLVTEILWAGLYALFFLLAFAHRERPVATLLGDRIISLLLGLAVLSTLWSDSPSVSLWENARLIATTFFAIYLAKTYSLGDIFHMLAWITAVAAALSIIFALALPEYGLGEYMRQSVWTGIFDQKNTLGGIMALGALTWFIVALGARQLRWLGVLVFAICSLLVVLAASETSLVIECVSLVTIVAFVRVHRSIRILGLLCLIALLALFFTQARDPVNLVLELLNRNQDLTGRTEIWSMVMDAILKHPWLGYGYQAFWRGVDGPSVDVHLSGWIPPHAHNGFLDLTLDLGIAGPLLFVCLLAGPGLDALRLAKQHTKALDLFPLVFLIFILLSNVTEGGTVTPNSIFWELLVVLRVNRSMEPKQPLYVRHRPRPMLDVATPVAWSSQEPVAMR
jgi:O-antigen ligase